MASLWLNSENEYRQYYRENFTQSPKSFITPTRSIPTYFDRRSFDHAFFESSNRNGSDDIFSIERASRMPAISEMLADSRFERRVGWMKKTKSYDPRRCVITGEEDFVVVLELRVSKQGTLKAKFITCYVADNSIGKIRTSPPWELENCLRKMHQN